MKNLYFSIVFLFFLSLKSFSQGSDVIIWVDNSGSVDNVEYADMRTSIRAIIQNILLCNPLNRVAVVQYGVNGVSKIYIESNFTSNVNVANSFVRRTNFVGYGDEAHGALLLIGNALDGAPNSNIFGNQILTRTPGNSLAVYLFTDAYRHYGLINPSSSLGIGTNEAFLNYTNFKNNRNAIFIVTHVPQNQIFDSPAGAAIASVGGGYTGPVESYPADPGGPGTTPRFYLPKTNFLLTQTEIDLVTDDICSVAEPTCVAVKNLVSPSDDVLVSLQSNHQASSLITASNKVNNGAVAIYHAGDQVVLTNGFYSANGSRFRGYIEGCTGNYAGKNSKEDSGGLEVDRKNSLNVSPNPSSSSVNIILPVNSRELIVSSIDGREMFRSKITNADDAFLLDVTSFKVGIYILMIQTENGEIYTEKIIKN
ncbi:3-coathanger stack domain-containing protein [Flavobacterium inviolabile]|uniref:3-coathanger stack domain-containing protein n=1 Tax=Flavobacterium inviolabile TaxID=2748320 RepID=UPI0015A76645|nr:3-coathanger stack domain-containing protein [Flavobacterium inviolabile]